MYRKLCEVIPGGVNSAARAFPGLGGEPLVVKSAHEDRLVSVDGKSYIDLCMSWGAAIHGHTPSRDAVHDQIERGTSYGLSTPYEEKLARKVVDMVPSIEQVRFVSSGTEATMSAVRLARGYTGRKKIVQFAGCYHGHADHLLPHPDLPPFNEEIALNEEVAAVIVEPIAGNQGVVLPKPGFLQHLRAETQRVGALLIFDEVITGFRVARGGAQELYSVMPDLTCLGKILGGGFPAAAFGGPREIMRYLRPEGPVFQAGTLSGNPVAMVAGLMALELCDQPGFYAALEKKSAPFDACGPRVGSMFSFAVEAFRPFFWRLFEQGIYISPSPMEACFVSSAHTDEHLALVLDAVLQYA